MTIKENVTLYNCDFCKKELKRKHAMEKHEDLCSNNPKNSKACFGGCIHLETVEMEVSFINGNPEYSDNLKKVEVFRCKKLDKLMFPYSIERRKLDRKYDTYDGQEPMPNKCESYEIDRSFETSPIDWDKLGYDVLRMDSF